MAVQRYQIDWSDPSFLRIVSTDGPGEDMTFTQAKAEISSHYKWLADFYRDQVANTRALRVADVEPIGDLT